MELKRISWHEYGELSNQLAARIEGSGIAFDKIVGIARGGVPLAMVIGDRLGVRIEIINVKSYKGVNRRTPPEILSTISASIKRKRILLVDDLVDHGDTMQMVVEHLKGMHPSEIRTAALFAKPWSTSKPDYVMGETDAWVVFPWEVCETERALKKQNDF